MGAVCGCPPHGAVVTALQGAGLGLCAAGGAWLALRHVPAARRPGLDRRLAPYLRDAPRSSRLLDEPASLTPFPTLERVLRPVLGDLTAAVERWVGGVSSVRSRLDQLGTGTSVEQFRAEQVLWGGFGLGAALAFCLLVLAGRGGVSPLAVLGLGAAAAVAGVLGRDRWLTRQVAARDRRMLEEFPTVAELLALAVTAGRVRSGRSSGSTGSPAVSSARSSAAPSGRPAPVPGWSRRWRGSPAVRPWRRCPASSTASRSPSSAAPRSPRSCARRPSTSARRPSGPCSTPPAARRSG